MKKQFTAILILLAVALALHVATREKEPGVDAAKLYAKVLDKPLVATDVYGIEIFKGKERTAAVALRRSGEVWLAASLYDATLLKAKVDALMTEIGKMEGEVRAESLDLVAPFQLGERESIHVRFTDRDSKEIEHVLLGKSGQDYQSCFTRRNGSPKSFYVYNNPLTALGVYGDPAEAKLEAKPFLDLAVLNLAEELKKVTLKATGEVLVAEYVTETTAEAEARRVGTQPVEFRKYWTVTQPAGFDADPAKVEAWAKGLKSVNAQEIEDPARTATFDYGTASIELVAENGRTVKLLFATREGATLPLRTEGGGKDRYRVADYEYNRLIKPRSEFARPKPPAPPAPAPAPKAPDFKIDLPKAPAEPPVEVKPDGKPEAPKPAGK